MEDVSRQLKKGFLDILLLKLMQEKTVYGYELMAALDESSGGYFAMKEGTLYPVLYRLEDAGLIESLWEDMRGKRGVPRKYYTITDRGREHLLAAETEIRALFQAIDKVMGGL